MRDYALLLMALILFIPVLTIGMMIHIYKEVSKGKKFSMRGYAFNIAYHLDKAGGAMLFNSQHKTISAMAYDKDIIWLVKVIDWIFRDEYHCHNAWEEEFKIGELR